MCSKNKKLHQHIVRSFVKDQSNSVYEGLLAAAVTNKNLVVLENHCIILRRDHKSIKGKVKIIGGGGAGIEPAEAHYVGRGMLTAAVMGRLFTAPSAHEILVAIRELAVDNNDGILLLVKNYLGDKLNFRLAMEQACSENICVKMLLIGDDIFHYIPARHGRKGTAGSVLVYKIVGELAEQGKMLEEIIEEYNAHISAELATISVSVPPCPNNTCNYLNNFVGPQEMVMGLGIYGKGGVKKIEITELKDLVSQMLEHIISFLKCNALENEIVVMVNNLGATTKFEEGVIGHEVSTQLSKLEFRVTQFYLGTFMTSLGSQGFSISILKVTSEEILNYLNAPTSAPAWAKTSWEDFGDLDPLLLPVTVTPSNLHDLFSDSKTEETSIGPILSEKATAAMKQIIIFASEALISCEAQLNIIDNEAGDGDTGTVLRIGAEALRSQVINNEIDLSNPTRFLYELSEICSRHMTGLSGALYNIFFKSAAKIFEGSTEFTPQLCCSAFKEAVKALKLYGNAELGERTLLDALVPAFESFEAAIEHGKHFTKAVYLAAITCEFKSEETKHIQPASMHHKILQTPAMYADAGTHAATIWLRAISEGLKLHYPMESFDTDSPSRPPGIFLWRFINEEESNFLTENKLSLNGLLCFFENKIGSDEYLLMSLLTETLKFCRKRLNNNCRKTSALVGTVYYTHKYFVASRWRTPAEVYFYFRESILRQAVESPPVSVEVFESEEAKDCVIFFAETYMRNLPIISILHLPHYKLRLKLTREKTVSDQSMLSSESKKK